MRLPHLDQAACDLVHGADLDADTLPRGERHGENPRSARKAMEEPTHRRLVGENAIDVLHAGDSTAPPLPSCPSGHTKEDRVEPEADRSGEAQPRLDRTTGPARRDGVPEAEHRERDRSVQGQAGGFAHGTIITPPAASRITPPLRLYAPSPRRHLAAAADSRPADPEHRRGEEERGGQPKQQARGRRVVDRRGECERGGSEQVDGGDLVHGLSLTSHAAARITPPSPRAISPCPSPRSVAARAGLYRLRCEGTIG